MNRADEILRYWFGRVEETLLPSENRTRIWFSNDKDVDDDIKNHFLIDWQKAVAGQYLEWENDPRGMLALIIIFDQFTRHIHRDKPGAFAQDQKALDLCLTGIQREFDHLLSLVERVFFYFPLMHAETIEMQTTAVRAYQILVNLSFPETRSVYENFLAYAIRRYEIIKRFGRFPDRNALLGRMSTLEEIEFLKNPEAIFSE